MINYIWVIYSISKMQWVGGHQKYFLYFDVRMISSTWTNCEDNPKSEFLDWKSVSYWSTYDQGLAMAIDWYYYRLNMNIHVSTDCQEVCQLNIFLSMKYESERSCRFCLNQLNIIQLISTSFTLWRQSRIVYHIYPTIWTIRRHKSMYICILHYNIQDIVLKVR